MDSSPRPTMQMIAEKAGVSKMTVSRSLNNDHRISKATREKVVRIASEMGYRKSPLVSALMTQIRSGVNRENSLVLAHVHNWRSDITLTPNLKIFRQAAKLQAKALGFGLDSFPLENVKMRLSRIFNILRSRGIQGVLFEHILENPAIVEDDISDLSIVAIGKSISTPRMHSVDGDQHAEILDLIEHLKAMQYRRIALINSEHSEQMNFLKRRAGFLLAQQDFPKKDRLPPLVGCPGVPQLAKAMPAYIERYRPDVILSQHLSVFRKLEQMGYQIPDEIGFAHLGWHTGDETFAGIDTNWRQRGIAAVNLLVSLLNRNEYGIPDAPLTTLVPSSFVNGNSLRNQSE